MFDVGEFCFKAEANSRNWKTEKSAEADDMYNHYDFTMTSGDYSYKVDVKGRKRLHRHDEDYCDEYVWIEFKNVHGDRGWLYGDADLISFETHKYINLVWRNELEKYAEKVFNTGTIYRCVNEPYKVCSRKCRDDMIGIAPLEEIINTSGMIYKRWNKWDF